MKSLSIDWLGRLKQFIFRDLRKQNLANQETLRAKAQSPLHAMAAKRKRGPFVPTSV